MQGEPQQPFDPDPAVAAGAVLQPAPAATVRGLVLETAWVEVMETALVTVPGRGVRLGLGMVEVWALVLDLAQGGAREPLQRQKPQPVVEPSGGHRPHGPKPGLHLLPQWLQELESAPALLKRELPFQHLSVPASAQGWASAPAVETPRPVVRTS